MSIGYTHVWVCQVLVRYLSKILGVDCGPAPASTILGKIVYEQAKYITMLWRYPSTQELCISEKSILAVGVKAIIQNEVYQLYSLIRQQKKEMTMGLSLAIGTHAWRADTRANQVGKKHSLLRAVYTGYIFSDLDHGRASRANCVFVYMGMLAAKHDEPLILDVILQWDPNRSFPITFFAESMELFPIEFFEHPGQPFSAPRCLEHTLKRNANVIERVEANRQLIENIRQPKTTPTAPPATPTQPPNSKRLSPPQPDGGESEHMRAYLAREAAESAARAEAERDARAKIEADRKERRVTASKPTRLNKGVNPPPQKTKNLVEGPLDAHARAKHVAQKAAAVEEAFVHASKLKAAEDARVAAAEEKLSLIRIGREIGGGF